MTKLNHPNIVKVHEYGQSSGIDYIVMNYIEGKTLDKLLLTKEFDDSKLLNMYLEFLDGIASIHKIGVIHRDLKLSNIIVTAEEKFVLIDFGLGKIISDSHVSSLMTTQIMGSPPYMAPEQTYPNAIHDRRTDIWALGAIFYHILTKNRIFHKKKCEDLIYAIRFQDHKAAREYRPELPWQLEAICNCALQKNKKDRYQSVRSMIKDIRNFLKGENITAKRFRSFSAYSFLL